MTTDPRPVPVGTRPSAARGRRAFRRAAAAALASVLVAIGSPAGLHAADVTATLPVVSGPPGAVVGVPVDLDRSLAGLGVYAIDLRLALDPGFVSDLVLAVDGPLYTWGAPFQNLQPTFFAASTGGGAPVSDPDTRLAGFLLTISPSAVPGTQTPLVLPLLRFNAGLPSVATVSGLLRVVGTLEAPQAGAPRLALGPARPNPASGPVSLRFEVPAGGGQAVLAVHAVDGRRVRTLLAGSPGPGGHEVWWDGRDAVGRPARPGLYFVRLTWGSQTLQRRLVLMR